jgi:hypothetical protein
MPRESYWTKERLKILKETCLIADSWKDCRIKLKQKGIIASLSYIKFIARDKKFKTPNIIRGKHHYVFWTEERLNILKEECLKAKTWLDCERRMRKRGIRAPWSTMQTYAGLHSFKTPKIHRGGKH